MALDKVITKVNKAIKDADERAAKLTTKQRKKMKSSTFCGPYRSFPVNDCAHVRAAKVYLKRSNFSGSTQSRIAACINRKAKALGCPGKIPAKGKGAVDDFQTLLESKVFESTRKLVDQSIASPDLELDFADCEDC